MSELKPCPFCGGKPESGVEFYKSCGSEVKLSDQVWCERCHVGRRAIFNATDIQLVPFQTYVNAFEKAVEKWNRRKGEQDG